MDICGQASSLMEDLSWTHTAMLIAMRKYFYCLKDGNLKREENNTEIWRADGRHSAIIGKDTFTWRFLAPRSTNISPASSVPTNMHTSWMFNGYTYRPLMLEAKRVPVLPQPHYLSKEYIYNVNVTMSYSFTELRERRDDQVYTPRLNTRLAS